MTTTINKGFTLIELLIVIGILAILATTVVLVLNPAQILQETRDTQRATDLDTLRGAINLYLSTVVGPDMDGYAAATCAANWWASGAALAATKPFTGGGAGNSVQGTTTRAVDGGGWIPVMLNVVSGGSPVSALPLDPNQDISAPLSTTGRFYAYSCDNTGKTFELNASMESVKYAQSGGADKESTDGGNAPAIYEVGNAAGLAL